jgi:hypothetical protein
VPSPASSGARTPAWLTTPRFVLLFSTVNLLVLAVFVGIFAPREKTIAANGRAMCGHFYSLVKDVRAQKLTVPAIKEGIDQLEAESFNTDGNLRYSAHYFVRASREAVTSYFVYPTFDLLAYSDTYEHMDEHMATYLTINALTKTCTLEGFPDKSTGATGGAAALETFQADHQNHASQPPSDAAIPDAQESRDAVMTYLHGKAWGYFGATCDQWVRMHYHWDEADSTYVPADREWVVDVLRHAEALGPLVVRYHVNAFTGATVGDASNHVDSFFAEGCDAG